MNAFRPVEDHDEYDEIDRMLASDMDDNSMIGPHDIRNRSETEDEVEATPPVNTCRALIVRPPVSPPMPDWAFLGF